MVLLHQQIPSRKRSSSFVSPFPLPKVPKPTVTAAAGDGSESQVPDGGQRNDSQPESTSASNKIDRMVSVLADAGCTLFNAHGPPCLPSDCVAFRRSMDRALSSDSALRSDFIQGFSSYVESTTNFRRVLMFSSNDGLHNNSRSDSLVRNLLLVTTIQSDLQNLLLEKLPEYFVVDSDCNRLSMSFEDDIARLILNQFRWLDFLVNPVDFADKLLQVLSISPLHLKKEIIGSLPEMIGDQNNKVVIHTLELMLQEDPSIIVPVLDSFANLNLDEDLHDQVITIALSCIRTVDADFMPYLLRFLLLSATPLNVRRIISQIREQLKFICTSNANTTHHSKLKGKSLVDNGEASILDALRSSLRFKNNLCAEILKVLKSLEKAQDHRVIDIWLLLLIHMNGETLRKSVEKIFRKKITEGYVSTSMLEQCVCGNSNLAKEYLPSFLSLSEHLLSCKEQRVREAGGRLYICMFEEFNETYARQEVLGALLTHVGSGASFEVDSALEVLLLLASNHSYELISLSSHINGILDFLEGFSNENLHKIYQMFGLLTFSNQSSSCSLRSPFANELMMILRKQVSNPDAKYKRMGIIGTLKVVSFMGGANDISTFLSQVNLVIDLGPCCKYIPFRRQQLSTLPIAKLSDVVTNGKKSNIDESIELLTCCYDSCKQVPLQLALFYDELSAVLKSKVLHPNLMEWINRYLGDFESVFLSDLEGGVLAASHSNYSTEGELWMNLDGDISPVCVNILPLVLSSSRYNSMLQTLPANFLLISMMERLANKGSLAGIDALLGCPLYLPSSKYFGASWDSMDGKQKETICLSLYYACNWLRELLNAFSTQVGGKSECPSQTLKDEMENKLLKRLRNLVFLESLLNYALNQYPLSLPELYPYVEQNGSSSSQPSYRGNQQKKDGLKNMNESNPLCHRGTQIKNSRTSKKLDTDKRSSQPTILEVLNEAGAKVGEAVPVQNSCSPSQNCDTPKAPYCNDSISEDQVLLDVGVATVLEAQRSKFRPLSVDCLSITTLVKNLDSCCPDSASELPLHSYLLHDLIHKIDNFSPSGKQFTAQHLSCMAGSPRMKVNELLSNMKPFLVKLRKNFNAALSILQAGDETCQDHWKVQSSSAAHPESVGITVSITFVAGSIFKETLNLFIKVLMLPETWSDKSFLVDLLEAFQPVAIMDDVLTDVHPYPLPGTAAYLYCGAFSFLEGLLDTVASFSFKLASEVFFSIKAVISSSQNSSHAVERNGKDSNTSCILPMVSILQKRLSKLAYKLLRQNWDGCDINQGWKSQVEVVEKILCTYLENNASTSDALEELACTVLPQVAESSTVGEDGYHGFPTLCSATFLVWYRTLLEKNLVILNKLVREASSLEKRRASVQPETVQEFLAKLSQSVNILVSLVELCRNYDKVTIHALAVRHGGKFVDSFLKVFDFLKAHFEQRSELIVQLVKELQKATRILQTLCSEAKGSKQTIITSKIPATKRSLERFLFHVKGLLHTTSNGCTFWMGNLKHKDLSGQVVSSQAYVDHTEEVDGDPEEADMEEQPCTDDVSKDQETE